MNDRRHYELEVVRGKDTTDKYQGGKQRETWLPVDVKALMNRYVQQADLEATDPPVDR